jgi:NTE family protein
MRIPATLLVLAAALAAGPGRAASGERAELPAPRPKVCLVLSGGGARGIAHIGVLRVLEELHVPVDCVVGTSAGAVIGGAYAAGASPDEIEAAIRGADWDRLLSDQPARADRSVYAKELERERLGSAEVGQRGTSVVLPRGLAGQHLQFYLQSLVAPAGRGAFDDLAIPYRAIATDFENGQMVVLDHGDLAAAIRASMSVPGAFAPVEIDGRILVDGGLVRNVGVDVARELGAERVIVVNVGASLLKRAEIGSVLSAAEQTLNILVDQNVASSLASLAPDDVLITPELGAFSATDFAGGTATIPAGEQATRRAARELAPLAIGAQQYAAWRAAHRRARPPAHYDRIVVDTSTLSRVPPASIRRLLGSHPDPNDPQGTIAALLGTDDFESVAATVEPGPEGATLVLRPVEKPWGPNYLHGGAVLSSDFSGESDFMLTLDQRATWLTDRGLEWRNRASVGRVNALTSELRQPLDAARRVFVAPGAEFGQTLRSVYQEHDALGTFRLRQLRGWLDLGVRLRNYGELRAGIETGADAVALTTGLPVVPDLRERVTAWRAALIMDRLDSLDFPRRGFLVSAARGSRAACSAASRATTGWRSRRSRPSAASAPACCSPPAFSARPASACRSARCSLSAVSRTCRATRATRCSPSASRCCAPWCAGGSPASRRCCRPCTAASRSRPPKLRAASTPRRPATCTAARCSSRPTPRSGRSTSGSASPPAASPRCTCTWAGRERAALSLRLPWPASSAAGGSQCWCSACWPSCTSPRSSSIRGANASRSC